MERDTDLCREFQLTRYGKFIPAFLLTPTVVALMACIHYVTPERKKVFSLIGLAFASVYTAIIPTNYYLQLFVVRLNLQSGTLDGLALLAQPNLHFRLLRIGNFGLRVFKSGDPICQSRFQWREAGELDTMAIHRKWRCGYLWCAGCPI